MKDLLTPRTGGLALAALALGLLPAAPATGDQCILDDLIVDASQCIGFDCVCNGETFGFDTLRLKENNLRIHFQDTSTLPNFPTNDWRIIINDSANGGASYFAIEDSSAGRQSFRVEAGAPSNALYVEADGDLGLGTANPVVDLQVVDGNTPTLRLEQNNSSGFTPQTWDVAGNEVSFFIRDVTNGSTLPLRIQPGTGSSTLWLDADERVGIGGETAPDKELHVRGTILADPDNATVGAATPNLYLLRSGNTTANIRFENGQRTWFFQNEGASGDFQIRDATGAATPFVIEAGAPALSLELRTTGVFIEGGTPLPDFVFDPDYELESIEEHAAYMWEKRHLPAVGAATVSPETGRTRINVLAHSAGVLEEVEKAHVYIEQLHRRLERRRAEIADLEGRLGAQTVASEATIRELGERLAGLEARLRSLESTGGGAAAEGSSGR